ncbi:MAG: hypothetical protein KAI81_00540, partial [Candidatus Marinimicrobia bacterium]|nr:hypothetical protein [Candidatus Neomarinimicrobiota bacterium]
MDKKEKLTKLGAEILANALIDLAGQFEEAENMVERFTATPEENIEKTKKQITGFKRRRKSVWGYAARGLASELNETISLI